MYSLILMTAMSSAPQGPEFNGFFRDLFQRGSCSGNCTGCYGTCVGKSAGCYGNSCHGFGSRIRSFFSFRGGNCNGGCGGQGSCSGQTSNSCIGSTYLAQGSSCCGGGIAYSCMGGMAFPSGVAPGIYGSPIPGGSMNDFAPYAVPGPIAPSPSTGPFAPNSPAPAPPVIEDRNSMNAGGLRGTVIVRLPADARLYAEGRALNLTSSERTFVTPALAADREYTYTFRVEYERDGEVVSQTRKTTIRPGQATTLEFADLVAAKAPTPVPTDLDPKPSTSAKHTARSGANPEPVASVFSTAPGNPWSTMTAPAVVGARARIRLKLPENATLYIDDQKKDGQGTIREFSTPELAAGQEYAYTMAVEVIRNGLPERIIEKVTFRAGEIVTRDFAAVFPGERQVSR